MSYDRVIKKLNVLEKLLKQEFVSIRKNLGDPEVVQEVNEEIKGFLAAVMESILSPEKLQAQPQQGSPFSPEVTIVLNELATRLLAKTQGTEQLPATSETSIHDETPPSPPSSPATVRRKGSPILDALQGAGFDPNAPIEERRAAIKKAERTKK